MSQSLIIIKLGGSVVTNKNSATPKINAKAIKSLAKEIKYLIDHTKNKFIIVHGAGSFGHPLAKKYTLHQGMTTDEQKLGFCLTDQKMIELNSTIAGYFLKKNIPVVSLSPRSFITQSAGKVKNFSYQLIQTYLENNQIPVLFGDVVIDDQWGCSILSGDIIVSYLAKNLKADQVIFLSDVDGIFDSDPKKNPKAKLVPEVTDKNLKQVLRGLTASNQNDVTGGMQGKIMTIKENLAHIPVNIVNGLRATNLAKAVEQDRVGTKLLFR